VSESPASDRQPCDEEQPVSESQTRAMISLLSDSNPKVVEGCRQALLAQGEAARLPLEMQLESATGRLARRVRSVLAAVRFPDADQQLLVHLQGQPDLERGALLIARLVDGGPEPDAAAETLDREAGLVMDLAAGDEEPDGQIEALRTVLRGRSGLTGVPPEESLPVDALLHGVTAGKRGMPLPLCMVWLLVARRAGIPLVGVNMPGHFLLRLDVPGRLRVYDAFSGGRPVARSACLRQLVAHGVPARSVRELGCDDLELLLRTLRNLVHLAASDGDKLLALRCSRLLAAMSRHSSSQRLA
jgi:regulator of sirC expression with transglutaminase-like and TPR domain